MAWMFNDLCYYKCQGDFNKVFFILKHTHIEYEAKPEMWDTMFYFILGAVNEMFQNTHSSIVRSGI